MNNRFTSFHLYEMHKLISIFLLIRVPSSHKPIVVIGASSQKFIFALGVFALQAILEERIKLVN
jgi:hypothetical protein